MANKVGKPLKFQSVTNLQADIDKYFDSTPIEEWTITGLAMALDTFRKVLCEYENLDSRIKYRNTIKKAKQKVEHSYEVDLKKSGRTGTIFALKNFEWKDQVQTDVTSKDKELKGLTVNTINYGSSNNTST